MFLFLIPNRDGRSFRTTCSMQPPDGIVSVIPLPESEVVNVKSDPQWLLRHQFGDPESPEEMADILPRIEERTLILEDRLSIIRDCCENVSHLDGMVAEVGVFKGGSLDLLSSSIPSKMVHGFDTFQGFITGPTSEDFCEAGMPDLSPFVGTSFADVLSSVGRKRNIRLHRGEFPSTARWLFDDDRFCLVHFDADLHDVAISFMETFYHRMVPGGKLIFDDYDFGYFPGVKTAVDHFLSDKPERAVQTSAIQCVVTKE